MGSNNAYNSGQCNFWPIGQYKQNSSWDIQNRRQGKKLFSVRCWILGQESSCQWPYSHQGEESLSTTGQKEVYMHREKQRREMKESFVPALIPSKANISYVIHTANALSLFVQVTSSWSSVTLNNSIAKIQNWIFLMLLN